MAVHQVFLFEEFDYNASAPIAWDPPEGPYFVKRDSRTDMQVLIEYFSISAGMPSVPEGRPFFLILCSMNGLLSIQMICIDV